MRSGSKHTAVGTARYGCAPLCPGSREVRVDDEAGLADEAIEVRNNVLGAKCRRYLVTGLMESRIVVPERDVGTPVSVWR